MSKSLFYLIFNMTQKQNIDRFVSLVARGKVKRRQLLLREASSKYLRASKKL